MIGPVGSYQDLYTAACGRILDSHSAGIRHESECRSCLASVRQQEAEDAAMQEDDDSPPHDPDDAAGAIAKLLRCLIDIVDIQDAEDRRLRDSIAILDGIATWEKLTGRDAVKEFNIHL